MTRHACSQLAGKIELVAPQSDRLGQQACHGVPQGCARIAIVELGVGRERYAKFDETAIIEWEAQAHPSCSGRTIEHFKRIGLLWRCQGRQVALLLGLIGRAAGHCRCAAQTYVRTTGEVWCDERGREIR